MEFSTRLHRAAAALARASVAGALSTCWPRMASLSADRPVRAKGCCRRRSTNFAPRVGFAYQVDPKLVVRGGFGLFFNSFENQGYGPNIGENYPFVLNFDYTPVQPPGAPAAASQVAPVSYGTAYAGCPTAGPGGTASLRSQAFSCITLYTSCRQRAWSWLAGTSIQLPNPAHLQRQPHPPILDHPQLVRAGLLCLYRWRRIFRRALATNNVSADSSRPEPAPPRWMPPASHLPAWSSVPGLWRRQLPGQRRCQPYHGLQTKLEQQFSNGLTFLLTYTFSKTTVGCRRLAQRRQQRRLRAPTVPGLGPKFDWALADFNIRQVVHFSGGYELPFGKDKQFLNQGGVTNAILGGWSHNWIAYLQGGQPINLGCPTGTTSGTGCNVLRVAGQSQQLGIQNKAIAANGGSRGRSG